MDKCQVSKRFAEIMYSIETVKIKVFFISLNVSAAMSKPTWQNVISMLV